MPATLQIIHKLIVAPLIDIQSAFYGMHHEKTGALCHQKSQQEEPKECKSLLDSLRLAS